MTMGTPTAAPPSTLRALVLGGTGDIGGAIVARLGDDGVDAVGVGRADFDLARPDRIEAYFDCNGDAFDILVHCAGLNRPQLFAESTDADIRESIEVNVHGFLAVARHCLPHWRQAAFGRVLVISSLYGFLGRSGRLPYAMSKHALNGAVKTLAIELAPYGVLVNALSPGYIGTRMTYANNPPAALERLVSGIPLGRLGTAADVAEVAAFLCSPRNRYLTGQDIVVDGGFAAGGFQR